MKRIAILTFLLLPCICAAAQNEATSKQATPAATPASQFPDSDFFEVSASRLDTAKVWLRDEPALLLSQREIEFFGQKNFHCSTEKRPYLIVANYRNGGTGSFGFERSDSTILVHHSSLGPASAPLQTALIVCLDFQPTQVISHISGAP
jgi:hypothetical protein